MRYSCCQWTATKTTNYTPYVCNRKFPAAVKRTVCARLTAAGNPRLLMALARSKCSSCWWNYGHLVSSTVCKLKWLTCSQFMFGSISLRFAVVGRSPLNICLCIYCTFLVSTQAWNHSTQELLAERLVEFRSGFARKSARTCQDGFNLSAE